MERKINEKKELHAQRRKITININPQYFITIYVDTEFFCSDYYLQ